MDLVIAALAVDQVVPVAALEAVCCRDIDGIDETACRRAAAAGADVADQRFGSHAGAGCLVAALVDRCVVADEDVVAGSTKNMVRSSAAGNVVVAGAAVDLIAIRTAEDEVVAAVAGRLVAAGAATDVVVPGDNLRVGALVAVHQVVALVAAEVVVAGAAVQLVGPGATDQ